MSDIDAQAAEWAVRVDVGALDQAGRHALDVWLEADARHRGAFLRAQAGLRLLEHGRVVSKVLPVPSRSRSRLMTPGRLVQATGWGLAAAGVVAVAWLLSPFHDFRTDTGEQRRVALRDGSVAMINTDSRVGVNFVGRERRIALRRGEAWFQVAKDHEHPFVVDAGAVHVRATGTAFAVRREALGARVVVTEGRVVAWRDGAAGAPLAISAGQEAFIADATPLPPKAQTVRTDDVLAWRRGEIVLGGETIASAVSEFNRYNERKIVLRDPEVGQRTIVGYFLIDQPQQFALAAARMTGGKMREDKNEIVIEHSQQKAGLP
ncbi:FecR family protein [Caulobacter segnis]